LVAAASLARPLRAAAAALLLSACAAPQHDWVKLGSTDAEAVEAKAQCAYEAESNARVRTPGLQSIIGTEIDRADHRNELMDQCMRARGFTAVLLNR
jgi:hypothetical protein